ncbi:MAG: radical SAM family heme chaperone HemW [Muribaculaceae bacterium]|nr:radical SAM family heme chaperone HemW [Muribaculaceae bacterium]
MAGIYLHVPFCHAKCAYCDFYSVARPDYAEIYASAVEREFALRNIELDGQPVRTLYFGGGTPSILPAHIFTRLARMLRTEEVDEFTVEANPEDIDDDRIAAWLNEGVNRVSIGVQSLDNAELKAINRRHSAGDALRAIARLQKACISNISGDLIYGLPGQTSESWRASVRGLAVSGVTHISAYCLSYEEGTLLTRKRDRGDITEASDEQIEEYYSILCDELRRSGFEHYEISNFALPGKRSRHNSAYWRSTPYLGLGPGAHSLTASGLRRFNPSDLRGYIKSEGNIVTDDPETETDRINDLIMIRLRTAEGIEKACLPERYMDEITDSAARWLKRGQLAENGTHLYIPEKSWLMSDAIIRDLMIY